MDKDYFINGGIPPPQPLHFESSMPIQWSSDQSNLVNSNSSIDQFSRFDSNWSSIAPSATTAAAAEAFAFRELIGKLGGGGVGLSGNANDCSNMPSTAALASPAVSADPRFAERAAKFSSFGSRSFNGRAPQLGPSNVGSNLPRVSSTPSLKRNGSPPAVNGGASSNEESSVSQQIPTGETASFNSRKRKAISRGKTKAAGAAGDENSKRWKPTKNGENETKADEELKEGSNDEDDKNKTNQKPPEPPKDYIHVRARRGQATDSHSLAERVRREKISERMKLLQDLVPGCNKVTGKALMLDEIINYVQSLQRQVEFLSMKLSSVNPSLDFSVENLLSKDILPQQMHHLDPPVYHHQNVQQQKMHGTNISSAQRLDANMDGFSENLPQFPAFTEDDLHSIFQMGFVQNSVNFPVHNQASDMKVEL